MSLGNIASVSANRGSHGRNVHAMSVAIVLKSPLGGGNVEVGERKGTGLISPALCSGIATMSGTSSGDDSQPVPEVLTEVPSDLEEDVANREGVAPLCFRLRRRCSLPVRWLSWRLLLRSNA